MKHEYLVFARLSPLFVVRLMHLCVSLLVLENQDERPEVLHIAH